MMARDERARLVRAATYASTSVALVLVVAKFAAWLLTGSVSLLSSLVDSSAGDGASWLSVTRTYPIARMTSRISLQVGNMRPL